IPLIYLPMAIALLHLAQARGQFTPVEALELVQSPRPAAGRREMLRDRRFWFALPAVLSGPIVVTGVFIQQSFILEQKNWSPAWFASCFVAYGALHWLSSIASGVLVDRFSAQRVLLFTVVPLVAGMFVAAGFEGNWVAMAMMAL